MKREEDIRSEHSVRLSPPSEGLGEVLTFLGTGTSNGVPVLGCNCAVCRSKDPRDNRLRTSALLETATTRIVIDSGPDFRQQMLAQTFRKIDGLLICLLYTSDAADE